MPKNAIPPQVDPRRRDLFRLATALTGLALVPRIAAAAMAADTPAATHVRVLRLDADGRLVHPASGAALAADFRLRVRGAGARTPLALDVRHGDLHAHRFWHAWRERDGSIAQSHAAAVTCRAGAAGLPLSVRVGGKDVACAVPAVPGTYVLAIAEAGRVLPAMETFRLVDAGGACTGGALQCAATQARADFSHVLVSVESLSA